MVGSELVVHGGTAQKALPPTSAAHYRDATLGYPLERLRHETRLRQDLGADGGGGRALIGDFGERYGVELTGFEVNRHFGLETGPSTPHWLWWTLARSWPTHVPITLRDLTEAARTRVWRKSERAAI